MCKLQLIKTTQNLLTNFNMEKINPIYSNFLIWHEAENYTGNTTWQIKSIAYVINLIMWLCLSSLFRKLQLARDQSDDVIYHLLLSKAITGYSFNLILYVEVEIGGVRSCTTPFLLLMFVKRAACTKG